MMLSNGLANHLIQFSSSVSKVIRLKFEFYISIFMHPSLSI
ncbi:hypothetical protein T11_7761 [Trichinella zimbabwensis]|uniref:Uncharacterized protein n=1 Tax=Trichinella zimbabwensis TaxID=268475 RepID=A0A0V1GIH2_9BILA|nr:hypothetical protein T11_7761 [Trichinella zimbabwensis]